MGLIVSERVVNCPLELSSPLQQSIFDEIKWATEDEPTQALRDSFKFSHFLLFTRVYFSGGAPGGKAGSGSHGGGSDGKKRGKKKAAGEAGEPAGEIVYVRPEDQFFHQECEWSFTFPARHAHDIQGLVQHRMVMWMDNKGVDRARQALDQLFGQYLPQ